MPIESIEVVTEAGPPPSPRLLVSLAIAALCAVPAVYCRIRGVEMAPAAALLIYGIAVVSGAFALTWAAETAKVDLSQGVSVAILALVAVLPEYVVDMIFAWKAGKDPEQFAPLALANMTGSNRLLIGFGWPLVVLLAVWAWRRRGVRVVSVELNRTQSISITFLAIATIYSLHFPFRGTINLLDTVILLTIFVAYVIRIRKTPKEKPDLLGPGIYIGNLPAVPRRTWYIGMFVVAAGIILASADPFAEALVASGQQLGIDRFLLVQWLAPLASESPEILAVTIFAWRRQASQGLETLISAKLNQWTLLVGFIPVAYALSSSSLAGLPIVAMQREELLLTAAQSVFAVVILLNLNLSVLEAMILLVLFLIQFVLSMVLPEGPIRTVERVGISGLYIIGAIIFGVRHWRNASRHFIDGIWTNVSELSEGEEA
ncbi:MAG: sodium:proton exchanger [Acidobacteriota bacterium]